MEHPLVSVVMPAFNAGEHLRESIESVLSQSYSNWELIIVDDGSEDNTALIAQEYVSKDGRIKYFYQTNGKQGRARNKGICESAGELIAFLDADDWWCKEKLEIQVSLMQSNALVSLIFSNGYCLENEKVREYEVTQKETWDKEDIPLFIDFNRIPLSSVMIRRGVLINSGMFSEDLKIQNAEDYELWMRLLYAGHKFCSIPDRLFYYRVHKDQSTFGHANLSIPLFTLYSRLYYDHPTDKFTNYLIARITQYLPYATFHKEACGIIIKWIKVKRPAWKYIVKIISKFPMRWRSKYLLVCLSKLNLPGFRVAESK